MIDAAMEDRDARDVETEKLQDVGFDVVNSDATVDGRCLWVEDVVTAGESGPAEADEDDAIG